MNEHFKQSSIRGILISKKRLFAAKTFFPATPRIHFVVHSTNERMFEIKFKLVIISTFDMQTRACLIQMATLQCYALFLQNRPHMRCNTFFQ